MSYSYDEYVRQRDAAAASTSASRGPGPAMPGAVPTPQPFDNRLHTYEYIARSDSVHVPHSPYPYWGGFNQSFNFAYPSPQAPAHPIVYQPHPPPQPIYYQTSVSHGQAYPPYHGYPNYIPYGCGTPVVTASGDRGPYHHGWQGRTEWEVFMDNERMAAARGDDKPKAIRPANPKDDDFFNIVDQHGYHYRDVISSIDDMKGEWKQNNDGSLTFHRTDGPTINL